MGTVGHEVMIYHKMKLYPIILVVLWADRLVDIVMLLVKSLIGKLLMNLWVVEVMIEQLERRLIGLQKTKINGKKLLSLSVGHNIHEKNFGMMKEFAS